MDIKEIKDKAKKEIEQAKTNEDLGAVFKKYLGKKSQIAQLLACLKNLKNEERKKTGKEINQAKKDLIILFQKKEKTLSAGFSETEKRRELDVTVPGKKVALGHLHPLTQIRRQAEEIFGQLGFEIKEGPEIETEYYNFDALNIPKEHPARDAWNTFWLKNDKLLLRTHTSPMQIRYMEKHNPPLKMIVPGRVFRYEATDNSHSHTFYQIEGLMIDKNINVANFKAVIEEFFKRFFKQDIKIRLRPSYFPFTEPSFEVDVKGGKFKDWLEIMGAGMVHPNVFKAVGYVPADWQGFAFGIGLERLAMIKYGIDDIRLFYSSDLRFLKQF